MKKMVGANKEKYGQPSYILGIVSIVLAFFTPLAALIFGIVGVVIGRKQGGTNSTKGVKLSKIGIIISIIVLILIIAISIIFGTKAGVINNFPTG